MDQQVYAGFFVRLAAYLIDWIIVGLALMVIRIPVWIASMSGVADFVLRDFIFKYSVYDIVLYLLKVTYFVLLTYFTGSTLGKKLLQIKVISAENRKPTFFEIVFRESVGKFLSALIIYVGYFMIGADKQKRGLHDILSDTCVIYQHQKTVAIPTPVAYNKIPYAVQVPPYQAGAAGQNPYIQPMNRGEMSSQGQRPGAPVQNVSPQHQAGAPLQNISQMQPQTGTPVQNMSQQTNVSETNVQQPAYSEMSQQSTLEASDSSKTDMQE